jgi:hypothetical protein
MAMSLTDVLRLPRACDHFVQIYTDDSYLGTVVADYIGTGLEQEEAAILIATPAHVSLFIDRLSGLGLDVPQLAARRRLLFLDAAQTLDRFMVNGQPDRSLFLGVTAAALDHVRSSGCRDVRLFGEMVDLLWSTSPKATLELERLWDEVLRDERLSLFCAYRLDPLDRHVQGVLRRITHCHSHLLPAQNQERFEQAIDRAYAEVFGVGADVDVLRELMVNTQNLPTAMREAQAAMFALDIMPDVIADDVRTRAHRHFVNGHHASTPGCSATDPARQCYDGAR